METFGIGGFTVEYADGTEVEYVVTTCDDGTFHEVREGDERGEVVATDEDAAREAFGSAFEDALEAARQDRDARRAAAFEARANREENARELNAQARRESFAAKAVA